MEEFFKSITCSGTECLCWVLVLLNILLMFYLVFCSFWKVTKIAKITGWVFSAGLVCAVIGILIEHTCVYTLLATLFSGMMIMAVLAVILPQQNSLEEKAEKKNEKKGAYVVSKTDKGRYAFALYDNARSLIVKSRYSYVTIEQAKHAIGVCRGNGMVATVNDKTGEWIREETYPSFEICAVNDKREFCLKINGEYVMLQSDVFEDEYALEKILKKAKIAVESLDVFFSSDVVNDGEYLHFEETAQVEEIVQTDVAVTEQSSLNDDASREGTEDGDASVEQSAIGGVVFNSDVKTLWNRYAELSDEQRGFFDAVRNYVTAKDGVKCVEAKEHLTFKYAKDKIVRLRIRKGTVEAVFMLVGSAFKQSFNENDLKVKEAATVIRIENGLYLEGVIKTIDMQYDALLEERRSKKEEQNQKRRNARKNKD